MYASVDVTCCPILQPVFEPKLWKCYKYKEHVLKYEVVICTKTFEIVRVFGPCPGGIVDGTIFDSGLVKLLKDNELIWADRGYIGKKKCLCPFRVCAQTANGTGGAL